MSLWTWHMIVISTWLSHDCHVTLLYGPIPVSTRDIAIYVGQVYGLKWGVWFLSTRRLRWKADSKPTLHIYCQGCGIVCPWRCVLTRVVIATVFVIYVSPVPSWCLYFPEWHKWTKVSLRGPRGFLCHPILCCHSCAGATLPLFPSPLPLPSTTFWTSPSWA